MATTQTWQDIFAVEDVRGMADFADLTTDAIQSQYAHAKRMKQTATAIRQGIDATSDLDSLLSSVADMQTATGCFLDWWGERVGVSREIKVNGLYTVFDDDFYRFLLFYRARCNVANATAATINALLSQLTDTKTFVVDYQNMAISSIVFIGAVSEVQAQILATYGLLNRPAGVFANYLVIYPDEQIFGFDGSGLLPWNQGVFNPGRNIPIS